MSDTLNFVYDFKFKDDSTERFTIALDPAKLTCISIKRKFYPSWTKLEHCQCTNCKLTPDINPYCPIAINLTSIIPSFINRLSYEEVFVRVITPERTYEQKTTIQRGLGSLLGILMVTCGCPTMSILKPMVRFHLPFASVSETVFRSAASYLLGQYFRYKNDKSVDWYMEKLSEAYEQIQIVNVGMAERVRSISEKDATANAVIVLDVFAKELPFSIVEGLKKLEYLYEDFIKL